MTWKKVNNASSGDADHFGGNDLDKISDLLSGSDVDDVDLNADWKFRSGKLSIANPTNSFNYLIKGAAISGNYDLTLPNISANDSLISTTTIPSSVLQNTLDNSLGTHYLDIGEIADPSAPGANIGRIYFDNTDEHIKIRKSGGTIVDLEDIGAPSNSQYITLATDASLSEERVLTQGTGITLADGGAGSTATISTSSVIPRILYCSGVDVGFDTTAAEQTLFSRTIPGNTMGTNGCINSRSSGYILQNQATGTDFTLRIKFGGTTLYQDNIATALAQSATPLPWTLDFDLFNINSASSNRMSGFFAMNDTSVSPTTGRGDITDDEIQAWGPFRQTGSSIDTTTDQTLAVTIQMSVSNVNVAIHQENVRHILYQGVS